MSCYPRTVRRSFTLPNGVQVTFPVRLTTSDGLGQFIASVPSWSCAYSGSTEADALAGAIEEVRRHWGRK